MNGRTVNLRPRPDNWAAAVWGLLLRVAITGAAVYILWRVRFIIVVVLVAAMLAFALAPVVEWMARGAVMRPIPCRFRRSAAATITFILLAGSLFLLGVLVFQPMASEVATFSANWSSIQRRWMDEFTRWRSFYMSLPPDVRQWAEANQFEDVGAQAAAYIQNLARHTMESGMFLVELILIPVLAFSFLTESRPLKREFLVFVPRDRAREALALIDRAGAILQSYAIGQLILALIAGGFTYGILTWAGVRYPLALALLAAVTRVIPVIGPVIGAIPIVILSSLQDWKTGVMVLIAFTLMHLIESKVIMPRVIGHRIHLHPAVVIVVLLIGAEFFGMWGMFLAAPVAAVIKVILNHFLVRPGRSDRSRPPRPGAGVAVEGQQPVGRTAIARVRGHSGAH